MAPSSILVCFALPMEARAFVHRPGPAGNVSTLITGMGSDNARTSVSAAFQKERPRVVLTCGVAGGLRPDLRAGDILFSADQELGLDTPLHELGARPGTFDCVDRVLVTAREKSGQHRRTGADAVEMESGMIRRLCRERGIPAATIRAISDPAGEDLPLDFNALMTRGTRQLDYAKLALALLRGPQRLPALIRLQRHTALATRRLGKFLNRLFDRWPQV